MTNEGIPCDDKPWKDISLSENDSGGGNAIFAGKEQSSIPVYYPSMRTGLQIKCLPLVHKREIIYDDCLEPQHLQPMLFHLKFDYYNKVKKDWCTLPEGLSIQAFYGEIPCSTRTIVNNGIYEVHILVHTDHNLGDRLHFTFNTKNQWIYTKDNQSTPRLVSTYRDITETFPETRITREDIAVRQLMVTQHLYDLPERWDSENWICSRGNATGKLLRFINMATTAADPLTFCLDDIVLTDDALRPLNPGGRAAQEFSLENTSDLNQSSRVQYLCFSETNRRLQFYSTAPYGSNKQYHEGSYFSFFCNDDGISRNYLHRPPANVRAVLFQGRVYNVTIQRIEGTTTQAHHGCGAVDGARAAIRNDPAVHYEGMVAFNDMTDMQCNTCFGDQTVHYLHNCGVEDGIVYDALIVCCASSFPKKEPSEKVGGERGSLDTSADNLLFAVMEKVIEYWNGKNYRFIDTIGGNDLVINPLFIFETGRRIGKEYIRNASLSSSAALSGEYGDERLEGGSTTTGKIAGTTSYGILMEILVEKYLPIRCIWRYVEWINGNSNLNGPLGCFIVGRHFNILSECSDKGRDKKLYYYRNTVDSTDIWKFSRGINIPVDKRGQKKVAIDFCRCFDDSDVVLGDDGILGYTFKSVLTVRLLIRVKFIGDDLLGWSAKDKMEWLRELNDNCESRNRTRFYLSGGGGETDPVLISVQCAFDHFENHMVTDVVHYAIDVMYGSDDDIFYHYGTRTITLGKDLNSWSDKLINFFFDKNPEDRNFFLDDFKFIETWYNRTIYANNTLMILDGNDTQCIPFHHGTS